MTVRILISTGEVSGDLQGALLIEALRRQAAVAGIDLEILALGGDRMAQAGATLLGNTTAIGSVGIFEALPFILPTLRLQQQAKQHLRRYPPDLVVMIDYFGPNSQIGGYMRRAMPQVPLVYYIAPQEWVWSVSPAKTRQVVYLTDRLLAIFPEEARYFEKWGAQVSYVGHPLVDRALRFPDRATARQSLGIPPEQMAIALIPASRHQEVRHLMPVFCEAARQIQAQLPQAHFWIPLSLEVFRHPMERLIQQYGLRATLVSQQSQTVIAAADLAITKSGTANLEIALADVPQVVVYRVGKGTAWVAKHLLKFSIPFMSPTNLFLMEPLVPEFLQDLATPDNITQASVELLLNDEARQKMRAGYLRLREAMGQPGVCDRAAQEILQLVSPSKS